MSIRLALQRPPEVERTLAKVCERCSDVDTQMLRKKREEYAKLIWKGEIERQTCYR